MQDLDGWNNNEYEDKQDYINRLVAYLAVVDGVFDENTLNELAHIYQSYVFADHGT